MTKCQPYMFRYVKSNINIYLSMPVYVHNLGEICSPIKTLIVKETGVTESGELTAYANPPSLISLCRNQITTFPISLTIQIVDLECCNNVNDTLFSLRKVIYAFSFRKRLGVTQKDIAYTKLFWDKRLQE